MTTTTTTAAAAAAAAAAARRRAETESESLLHGMASDDESDEEAREEVSSVYKYYREQSALPWWRRRRDPMVHSLITRPPWAEIIRGICFLCIGTALVTFGCLIYTNHVSFMEPRAGITLIIAGCLLFIPGVYVTMLTTQAVLGLNGTTYDDIPGATL